MSKRLSVVLFFILLFGMFGLSASNTKLKTTPVPTFTLVTPLAKTTSTIPVTVTSSFTPTSSATPSPSSTPTVTETLDVVSTISESTSTETITPVPTFTSTPIGIPYSSAPLCVEHDVNEFHTLWNSSLGCHYDHEHGQTPFITSVNSTFPDFDLKSLLGNVEIGHTNPSSPMENTMKHGGMKWQVDLNAPNGCTLGFEDGTVAVDAYAIQYHSFGPQSIEFEANKHSAVFLLRQCKSTNPSDKGYMYVVTLQNYGERCTPYQGQTLQYPDDFLPRWDCQFGPYFTTDNNVNRDITNQTQSVNSKWTSKPTGCTLPCVGVRPSFNPLARLLFDVRDTYQIFDLQDLSYPFTWIWMCGSSSYNPIGCRYNNSTGTIHEIAGDIPSIWDNVSGLDSDMRVGRITGDFFVDVTGSLQTDCSSAGNGCYPIKLISAFVGKYSSNLCFGKCSINTTDNTKERDIYFCGQTVCNETVPGALPSNWIGSEN